MSEQFHVQELESKVDELYDTVADQRKRIAALEAERDVVRRAWEAAEARIAALVIERETLTRQVRSLTSDLEAEWLDPDRKLHGIPGLVYTPDPDGCDPRMMRIDDPQTGAMGFGKGLWDAAYDLYDTMRDRLTASQAHAARLTAAGEAAEMALRPLAYWRYIESPDGKSNTGKATPTEDEVQAGRAALDALGKTLAATPADSLAYFQEREAHLARLTEAVAVMGTVADNADACGLLDEERVSIRAWTARSIRAALAATPADSLARQRRMEAVAAAAAALDRGWDALRAAVATGEASTIYDAEAANEEAADALHRAVAALAGEEGQR